MAGMRQRPSGSCRSQSFHSTWVLDVMGLCLHEAQEWGGWGGGVVVVSLSIPGCRSTERCSMSTRDVFAQEFAAAAMKERLPSVSAIVSLLCPSRIALVCAFFFFLYAYGRADRGVGLFCRTLPSFVFVA